MGARWLGGVLVVGLAAIATVSPDSSKAKSGYSVWPGGRESQFTLKGTHGYRLSISHTSNWVQLHASKGDASTTYLVRAPKPNRDGTIKAAFPGVGRISVRFRPSGPLRRIPPFLLFPGCRGGVELRQRGTFRGTIRFEGEENFTRVSASRARGSIEAETREVCKGGGGDNGADGMRGYSLTSSRRSHGRSVLFWADRDTSEDVIRGFTTYWPLVFERRRGMKIIRQALIDADPETFAVAGPPARPTSASVTPPAPFHGTATFDATQRGPAWTGTLAIDLPGASGVRLTGPDFRSRLCHNRRCRGNLTS